MLYCGVVSSNKTPLNIQTRLQFCKDCIFIVLRRVKVGCFVIYIKLSRTKTFFYNSNTSRNFNVRKRERARALYISCSHTTVLLASRLGYMGSAGWASFKTSSLYLALDGAAIWFSGICR